MTKYDKETFEEMIRDWKSDNAPEYDDLEIDEIIIDEDTHECEAIAHDKTTTYSLTDDGNGNIVINYIGTK